MDDTTRDGHPGPDALTAIPAAEWLRAIAFVVTVVVGVGLALAWMLGLLFRCGCTVPA
jgi:hypothetical protein